MLTEVTKIFDARIEHVFAEKPDLKRFLLTHDRKKLCLENLCYQIRLAELGSVHKLLDKHYFKVIQDVADNYSRALLNYAEQRALSNNEHQRLVDKAERMDNLEAEFNDMQKDLTTEKAPRVYVP